MSTGKACAPARLVLDRLGEGRVEGWAFGGARAELSILIDGDLFTRWPRDLRRADVDQAVGERMTPKGFAIPLDPLQGFLGLCDPVRRPRLTLSYGDERVALEAGAPAATMTSLLGPIADLWLADSHHLRLRTRRGVQAITVGQFGERLIATRRECPKREAVLTVPLADGLSPILLALEEEGSQNLDLVPFPSLLRGGLHASETLAMAAGAAGLPALATHYARALIDRRLRPQIRVRETPLASALSVPRVRRFVSQHADLVPADRDEQAATGTPVLAASMLPTIASLCMPAAGLIAEDPAPGGAVWLLRPRLDPALDAMLPAGDAELLAVPAGECDHPPAAIRTAVNRDVGLDPYLFPLDPEAPYPEAEPFVVALAGPPSAALILETLPGVAKVRWLEREPDLALASLAGEARPVLFAHTMMLAHDRRVFAALQRMIALEDVASAGCSTIREPDAADTSAADRVRIGGLFPTHAAVDAPWRGSLGPVAAAGLMERAGYMVAANDANFAMISPDALARFGEDLVASDPASLPALMASTRRAGWRHAATTWFSVFDRGAPRPPLVSPALDPPARGVTTVTRLA